MENKKNMKTKEVNPSKRLEGGLNATGQEAGIFEERSGQIQENVEKIVNNPTAQEKALSGYQKAKEVFNILLGAGVIVAGAGALKALGGDTSGIIDVGGGAAQGGVASVLLYGGVAISVISAALKVGIKEQIEKLKGKKEKK